MGLGFVLFIIVIGAVLAALVILVGSAGNETISGARGLVDRSPRVLPIVDRDGRLIIDGVSYADGE